jgi:F-type H+-transporting ATPase subunit a
MNQLGQTLSFFIASAEGGEHKEVAVGFKGTFIYLAIVLAVVFVLMGIARDGFSPRVFKGFVAGCAEQLYLFLENLALGTIGSHGKKYIPVLATFWLLIFFGNVVAVLMGTSPTAILSFNLGMAITTIAYVQVEGVKSNGLFGHLTHFAGPKIGVWLIPVTLMIFVVEIISEMMKNLSLSLRLFGNISGGHKAVEAVNQLGINYFVPVGEFMLPIKLLTCVVQAMIFALLTCVYLGAVTHHDEEHAAAH